MLILNFNGHGLTWLSRSQTCIHIARHASHAVTQGCDRDKWEDYSWDRMYGIASGPWVSLRGRQRGHVKSAA
eukprot:7308553-Prymnesium_polylepis.1